MKASLTSRDAQRSSKASAPDSFGGPNGAALSPPAYGIESIDGAMAEAAPVRELPSVATQLQDATATAGESAHSVPPNNTGLPDQLKAGIEHLSGLSLDDVNVHYNSARPAQLQALAYTQGNQIYVGPGQQRHLPHETWHVVQQKQGRVRPTCWVNGTAVNNSAALEQEADLAGASASALRLRDVAGPYRPPGETPVQRVPSSSSPIVQMIEEDTSDSRFIKMDYWGHRKLEKDDDEIKTSAMTSCVSIVIYNDKGDAILAHFGSRKVLKIQAVKDDVTSGVESINERIGALGGKWAGWVWTGAIKKNPISEARIKILTEKLNATLARVGPYKGGGIYLKKGAINTVWEEAVDFDML